MRELFVDMFNGRYKDVLKHWAADDPEDEVQVRCCWFAVAEPRASCRRPFETVYSLLLF